VRRAKAYLVEQRIVLRYGSKSLQVGRQLGHLRGKLATQQLLVERDTGSGCFLYAGIGIDLQVNVAKALCRSSKGIQAAPYFFIG